MIISQSILIEAEAAEVWRHIVSTELISEWLMPPIDFAPSPGKSFRLVSECDGRQEEIQCVVQTVEPNRCFEFSWRDTSIGLESVVTIVLTSESKSRTRVTLTQGGWEQLPQSIRHTHAETWVQILSDLRGMIVQADTGI